MSLFLEDFDQWCEAYGTASPQVQYEMVLEIIAEPIPLDYAIETDIASILIDIQTLLVGNGLLEQALTFTKTFQTQQPELYQKEFYYFDNFLVRYALFKQEPGQMNEVLARYQQDPVNSIEQLLPMLDDLRFYDARAQAVTLSRAVYTPVATASALIEGSEDDFSAVMIADMLEQAYEKLREGESVDWAEWGQAAAPFSFENTAELRQEVAKTLSGEAVAGAELANLFPAESDAFFRQLSLRFNLRMADRYRVSFVCSQAIWSAAVDFLGDRTLSKAQVKNLNRFFSFEYEELDRYVGRLIGGFLSSAQSKGFATLWGLPYLYEFLRAESLIEDFVYDAAITIVTQLQAVLLENWPGPLWRYSFIHRWGKPDHQTESEFAEEAQRFASTIDNAEPLSTEPIEKPSWDDMLTNLAEDMAEKLSGNSEFALPEQTHSSATSTANLKAPKAPKPKKSPLKEAKALSKKAKSANPKKKKGRGFT